jgi:uncharacterized membrane protein
MLKPLIVAVFVLLTAVMMATYVEFWPLERALNHNAREFFAGRAELSTNYNANEASHLLDVKRVLWGVHYAWIASGLLSLLFINRRVLRPAGGVLIVIGALGLVGGIFFGPLFTAFHGVFFAAGTWVFPDGSLILRVFPIGFFLTAYIGIFFSSIIIGLFFAHKNVILHF